MMTTGTATTTADVCTTFNQPINSNEIDNNAMMRPQRIVCHVGGSTPSSTFIDAVEASI